IVTRELSSRNESISTVLPAFYALTTQLSSKNSIFATTINDGLKSRMNKYLNEKFLIIATFLDPRYKLRGFPTETDRKVAKTLVESELESTNSEIQPLKKRKISSSSMDPIAQFLGDSDIESLYESSMESQFNMEIKQYLLDDPIPRDADPKNDAVGTSVSGKSPVHDHQLETVTKGIQALPTFQQRKTFKARRTNFKSHTLLMPQSAYHLSHMFPSTSRNEETEISPQHNPAASQSDHESSNSVNYGSSPEETFNDEL
uniref:Uncharacterized protein n=1 Tax=Meloidogyne javanica TaxID=6303 RepID=A0A915LDR2_MELJA